MKKTETKSKAKAAVAKKTAEPKTNLLMEAAKRKAADQASGKQKSQFGKDLGAKLGKRGDTFFVPTKPGGRNGQGKP